MTRSHDKIHAAGNRQASFTQFGASRALETWRLAIEEVSIQNDVDVRVGKQLDVLTLKNTGLAEIRAYSRHLSELAKRLYGDSGSTRVLESCPCCDARSDGAEEVFRAFDIPYHRCPACGHVYVVTQPSQEVLDLVFAESEELASAYTDEASLRVRMEQVVRPKADWVLETYRRHWDEDAHSLLDVGAGGGHFVEGMRRKGIASKGIEISTSSRRFAREAFDLDLDATNFLDHDPTPGSFDVLTFWGLLEYTPAPRLFLETARRMLDEQRGMLIVEVPRFDCMSTLAQRGDSAVISRHLDPTSHVNCFSDSSLLTALVCSGFRPVAAWYFGMDAYEQAVQISLELNHDEIHPALVERIPEWQSAYDAARLCDDLIVAAIPSSESGQPAYV